MEIYEPEWFHFRLTSKRNLHSLHISRSTMEYDGFLLSRIICFNFPVVSNWNLSTTHKRIVCLHCYQYTEYCTINSAPIFQLHLGDCTYQRCSVSECTTSEPYWPHQVRLAANLCVSDARYLWLLFIFSLVSAQCLGFIWKKKNFALKVTVHFRSFFLFPYTPRTIKHASCIEKKVWWRR
jgi:hypothetical protein